MQPNAWTRVCFWVVAGVFLSGCGTGAGTKDATGEGDAAGAANGMQTAVAVIPAATGGTVALPDGTGVEIPAGALAKDTEIKVSRPEPQSFGPNGVPAAVLLEPEGLTFSAPVKVTIPFDSAGVDDPTRLHLVMASTLHEQSDSGGETSAFEMLADAERQDGAFVAEIDHFSMLAVAYHPDIFVTPALPGKYMRPGDILYSVTNATMYVGGTLFPTHVGMFAGGPDNDLVIESTISTPGCNDAYGVVEGKWEGFCGFWHLNGEHILTGIRRPSYKSTVEQGEAAVAAAKTYVGNTSYGVVGLSTPATGLTCVQLTEQAWEQAGVNISYTPDILLTPHNQFENTIPVTNITVDVKDGEVKIPVVMAVHEGIMSGYTALGKNGIDGTVTLISDFPGPVEEGRAKLVDVPPDAQEYKALVFQPNQEDVGWFYTFGLEISVPSLGISKTMNKFVRIKVEGETGGTGPACPMPKKPYNGATPYYVGRMMGYTWPGGDFLTEAKPDDPWPHAYLGQTADGTPYLDLNASSSADGGSLIIKFPLPGPPMGGVTQTITHPGSYQGMEDNLWGYDCMLPDGRLMSFSTFDTFNGAAKVTPTPDCSGLVIEVEQIDEAWDDVNEEYVECVYTGTFTGTLCEKPAGPDC